MEIQNLEIKKIFFDYLNERQKRYFTAIMAKDLGHGGQISISKAFGIEADTVRRGLSELELKEVIPTNRIRKQGGGRKKKLKHNLK
jgi:predicted ArsR family transcriptional regulator